MYAFQYERATDPQSAVAKLKADGDAKILAGGQSLLAAMKLRLAAPSTLIDINRNIAMGLTTQAPGAAA